MRRRRKRRDRWAWLKAIAHEVAGWFWARENLRLQRLPAAEALERARRGDRRLEWLMGRNRDRNLRAYLDVGEGGSARLEELRRAHREYMARVRLNTALIGGWNSDDLRREVGIEGAEHLERAAAGGRGVLVLAAHAGNWWHAAAALPALGYRAEAVVSPGLPRPMIRHMNRIARNFGRSLAFVGEGAYEAARARFREGGAFFIAFDFSVRPEHDEWLELSPGLALKIDPGPVILALRHRVPVVWARCWYDARGRSRVAYLPPVETRRDGDFGTRRELVDELLRQLREQIEARPEQWWLLTFGELRRTPSPR